MSKLGKLAVALLALAAIVVVSLICHQIEKESQASRHHGPAHAQTPKKAAGEHPVNVIAWYLLGQQSHGIEVVKFSKGIWVKSSLAAAFVTTPQGIRLIKGPKAEVVQGDLRYVNAPGNHPYPQWNGTGLAPLTRSITVKDGKERQLSLKEIYLQIYDPRFPEATKAGG